MNPHGQHYIWFQNDRELTQRVWILYRRQMPMQRSIFCPSSWDENSRPRLQMVTCQWCSQIAAFRHRVWWQRLGTTWQTRDVVDLINSDTAFLYPSPPATRHGAWIDIRPFTPDSRISLWVERVVCVLRLARYSHHMDLYSREWRVPSSRALLWSEHRLVQLSPLSEKHNADNIIMFMSENGAAEALCHMPLEIKRRGSWPKRRNYDKAVGKGG